MTTPPRVLFFIPALSHGGAERVVISVANGLAADGWPVGLVTLFPGGELRGLLAPAVTTHLLGGRAKTPWERLRTLRALARVSDGYDILVAGVHLTTDTLVHGVRTLQRAVGVKKRYVALVQVSLSQLLEQQGKASRLRRVRAIYPHFDAVCCVSHGVKTDLETLCGPLPRARVIYNPLDAALIRTRAAEPLPEALPPFFLNNGRMDGQKGQALLLRAYARYLQTHGPTHHLVILGDGPLRGTLEAQADALGLTPYLHLPGYVDNPWAYLAQATALVSTSVFEGFSLVIAEAMVCGIPVIATACPHGPRELLEDGAGGYLLPLDDDAGLAAAMARVVAAPEEAAAKAARATQFVASLTVARAVAAYEETLRGVMA